MAIRNVSFVRRVDALCLKAKFIFHDWIHRLNGRIIRTFASHQTITEKKNKQRIARKGRQKFQPKNALNIQQNKT